MSPSSSKTSAAEAREQVRGYIAALAPQARKAVRKLRATIRAAAPGCVDAFSYGIPAFRLDGQLLIWYAGWKQHSSLYPIGPALIRNHRIDLKGHEISKGTVRFAHAKPLPLMLVRMLVKARIAELRRGHARGKR